MEILKNYKSSIFLIISVIIGGVIGLIMGERASIFAPLGTIFLNLIFTILIPLVFFSISSAIANMDSSKKLGKILGITIVVFVCTAIISGIIGVTSFKVFNPAQGLNSSMFTELMNSAQVVPREQVGFLEKIVSSITVGDFSQLLSRSNLLALIIFSMLIGFGTMLAKEEGKEFSNFLSSGAIVVNKVINIIMYYAPIGLAAYFANVVGQLGSQILSGYAKVFVLYLIVSIVYFIIFFTLYAYIAGGKEGIKAFRRNSTGPSVTALATCSSAACIPVNIQAAKNMGVSSSLANIVMPLGVNIHKDGSVIGGIYKIMFLFAIFGRDINSLGTLTIIFMVGLLVGAVVGAIPVGGSIGEMLILSIFGFPPEASYCNYN